MPRLTLIGGPSGSGKSTLAKHIWRATPSSFHFETDSYFVDSFGIYRFDPSKLSAAHAWCQGEVEKWMAADHRPDIIVSNTFTQAWERKPYIDLAQKHNYDWAWIPIFTSLNDDQLAHASVHDVPVEIIRKQRVRFAV